MIHDTYRDFLKAIREKDEPTRKKIFRNIVKFRGDIIQETFRKTQAEIANDWGMNPSQVSIILSVLKAGFAQEKEEEEALLDALSN